MGSWILIYDGDCGFCRRQVERVRRWDRERRVQAIPFQELDLVRFGVSRADVEEAMHLVSPAGEVWRGAQAARELLHLLPRVRPLVWLFSLPGVMFAAERAYRWVARHRHRFGCESEVCRRGGVTGEA